MAEVGLQSGLDPEQAIGLVHLGIRSADADAVPQLVRDPHVDARRRIDYYRHTAFEFVTDRLGAQGAVIAGGRYDGLVEQLGGPATPAVGWAAGIERLAMLIDKPAAERIQAAVVPLGPAAETAALRILADLRHAGIAADMALRGNMKKRMQKADASGAAYAVILGDDELARGEAAVKDLQTGEQRSVGLDGLAEAVRER